MDKETKSLNKVISENDKTKMLQSTLYQLIYHQHFYGSLLQELTIKYSENITTAGFRYNKDLHQYEILINPVFFSELTQNERVAVFHHEILHFTNKHLFRVPFLDDKTTDEDRKLYNIAGDMAINQYIKNLPKGCVDVKEWKLDNGDDFPTFLNMENYYDLIKKESMKQKGNEKTLGNVNEKLENFKTFDIHDWWNGLDEETKKKMLDEAKKIINRTIEKTQFTHSSIPDSIKDLLVEIDVLKTSLDYKAILKNTIKKTISYPVREHTWKKPNKRYGVYSPGSKIGSSPNLNIYIDTSGSISIKEMNTFVNIMNEFLKNGSRNCRLGLWHTELYYNKKHSLKKNIQADEIQAGGTNVQCVLNDIQKTNPNLSIILTDMYFDHADFKKCKNEVIFIISEGGNVNHEFKLLSNYKVIPLDKLK